MRVTTTFWSSTLAVLAVGSSQSKHAPAPAGGEERVRLLEQEVDGLRRHIDKNVEAYTPKVEGRIDDIAVPAADLLRQLPGVADVEVLVTSPEPTHRIIHLRDWHYVAPDLFALDVRQAADRSLSDPEVDVLYREYLLQVESVTLEQEVILRCLVNHHGLRSVLAEGLTPKGVPTYKEVVSSFRDTDRKFAELKTLRASLKKEAPDLDREIDELDRGLRRQLVPFGAAGRLAVADQVAVLPLDDDELLEKAKPVSPDGKVRVDAEALEARHDGMVRAAMASGPCALIILGGSHDLSGSVRRLGMGKVEYVRVTTARFKEAARW